MAYQKLKTCLESVQKVVRFSPKAAIVLGSGLGGFANEIDVHATLDYNEIEGFPVSTVEGHRGRFVFGHLGDVPVVAMQGRVHFYEGYPMSDVVLPVRLMGLMGAQALFLTNAAGGVNRAFSPGDFMLIRDHISTFVPSPLQGPNISALGTRFPDMSCVYDRQFAEIVRETAKSLSIPIQEGVYLQTPGPNFETPAEVVMCRTLGADAVGMSTACEAIAARHMGMRICGISCISNLASGMSDQPLTHAEVQETADRVAPLFQSLLRGCVTAVGQTL